MSRRGPTRAEALERVRRTDAALDRRAALARDPLRFPRSYAARRDRELVAAGSALLAFGRVEIILAKLGTLWARLGPSPYQTARESSREELQARLEGFRHRTFDGAELASLLHALARAAPADPARSLYAPLEEAWARHRALRPALSEWTSALRAQAFGAAPSRSARHLLPDPAGPSACKRLLLLLRWLVRPDDGVDLGLVDLPPSALLVPLDVHVHRQSVALGFTRRRSADWRCAEEVTQALRALDPEDPVRFDFALCHEQIARFRER